MHSVRVFVVVTLIVFPILSQDASATELPTTTHTWVGRKVLCLTGSCLRSLANEHHLKTPQVPQLNSKTVLIKSLPKRVLLEAEPAVGTQPGGDRKLLCFAGNCIRNIATVQNHKTPTAPTLKRKNFDVNFPKRALLAVENDSATVSEAVMETSRRLLCFAGSCVRSISKVQTNKTPDPPQLKRKNFDQVFPKKAL